MRSLLLAMCLSLALVGCYRCPTMTCYRFDDIEVGEAISKVENCFGKPYKVICCKDGTKAHVYIERLYLGDGVDAQRHYILKVRDGLVVDTRCEYYDDGLDIVQFDEHWAWED